MSSQKRNPVYNNILKNWISDFEDIRENEEVCIISGEGYYPIMNKLYGYFEKHAKENNAQFHVIIGPVVCVDSNGNNPLFDLAKNNIITLYKAPSRERQHFRTFGLRKAFVENYHPAVTQTSKRVGNYFDDPLIVSKLVTIFHNKVKVFKMQKYKGSFNTNDFICLTIDEIERIREPFGDYYDSLFEEEIRELAKTDDIFKTSLYNTFRLCYV